ncbi:hypothetical protein D3C74_375890 [compost metagenome]
MNQFVMSYTKPGTGRADTASLAVETAEAADCASTVVFTASTATLADEAASVANGAAGIRKILSGSTQIFLSLSIPSYNHMPPSSIRSGTSQKFGERLEK